MTNKDLEPKALQSIDAYCPSDKFENAIREFGIGNACEWFGYMFDGPFAQDTIETLKQRALGRDA
jgi:hypothetical protein